MVIRIANNNIDSKYVGIKNLITEKYKYLTSECYGYLSNLLNCLIYFIDIFMTHKIKL